MSKGTGPDVLPSSFRDPEGFLYTNRGELYRQINLSGRDNYESLMSSGLYRVLTEKGMMIPHEEVKAPSPAPRVLHKTLKPVRVPFISYPYEWSFGMLKDAALLTLSLQKTALKHQMSLKDCSAYNIQFLQGKPVFIDTLSFEKLREGEPWAAYRQFCQHFLAPLALMALTDVRLGLLMRDWIDGIPLDLASRLLPASSRLKPGLLTHIHLHAGTQKRYADREITPNQGGMGLLALRGLVESLESTVKKLNHEPAGTEWSDYYGDTNYTDEAMRDKQAAVALFLDRAKPTSVWDLGANTGAFSRLASERGIPVLSLDVDPSAVEKNYRDVKARGETLITPLLMDLSNPSPGLGWAGRERMSLTERGPADLILALALIHHLAISHNLPLGKIAAFLRDHCHHLIIEFIPKEDSQIRRLMRVRKDIFSDYDEESFRKEFGNYFHIREGRSLKETGRTLYLMQRKK